ncbi:MAG: hypothetical protein R3B46_03600 [Phycisphaerales bacterium]
MGDARRLKNRSHARAIDRDRLFAEDVASIVHGLSEVHRAKAGRRAKHDIARVDDMFVRVEADRSTFLAHPNALSVAFLRYQFEARLDTPLEDISHGVKHGAGLRTERLNRGSRAATSAPDQTYAQRTLACVAFVDAGFGLPERATH